MNVLRQLMVVGSLVMMAQAAQAMSAPSTKQLSLSTDSLTWALDGYSVIGSSELPQLQGLRFHLEAFGIKLPESIIDGYGPNTGDGWQRRIDWAIMLSVDHHPFGGLKGLHWGAGFNVQESTVSRKSSPQTESYATFEPLVRLGYQWFPRAGTGLFITPYVALGFPIHLSEPGAIEGDVYEEAAILPVGSIQIGWRFPLSSR